MNSCATPCSLPFDDAPPHGVNTLLPERQRTIVLDLARVPSIDAAGVGELVRAYNVATAADRVLRIANTTPRVREILELVGLYDRLSADHSG